MNYRELLLKESIYTAKKLASEAKKFAEKENVTVPDALKCFQIAALLNLSHSADSFIGKEYLDEIPDPEPCPNCGACLDVNNEDYGSIPKKINPDPTDVHNELN
jgi:hypothetical protein